MPDLEIVFRSRAELEGAKQTEAQLERDIGKAKALGKEYGDLEEKLKRVHAAIAAAPKPPPPPGPSVGDVFQKVREGLGEIIPGFAKLDGLISKFAGGTMSAISGGFEVLASGLEKAKHAIEEFSRAEDRVARLDAALAQSGHLTDEYRERLQELAHEFQHATGVAEEQWLGVLTKLTQFGADKSNIDEYAEAVKNLAGILGGDVQSAAALFSRAIQGNFMMLSRYGIHVQETGTLTEKLDGLMLQLAQRGGGQLEATTKTLGGSFTDLKNKTADLFKGVGRQIAETGLLQHALGMLGWVAEQVGEKFSGPIKKVDGLANAVVATTQTIDGAVPKDDYAKALKKIEDAAGLASLKLDGVKASVLAVLEAEAEVAAAKKESELADVDNKVKTGEITQAEGDRRKGKIEARDITDSADRQKKVLEVESRFASVNSQVEDYNVQVAKQKLYQFKTLNKRMLTVDEAKAEATKDDNAVKLAMEEREKASGRIGTLGNSKEDDEIDKKKVAYLDKRIPKLREKAAQSQELVDDYASNKKSPDTLKQLEDKLEEAVKAAALAKQALENINRLTAIKTGAIDKVTPQKLRTLGAQTGTKLVGDHEEESHQQSAALDQFHKTGITTASGKTVAAIQKNTQITAEAFNAITNAMTAQNEKFTQQIKILKSQANENRNRGN